MSMCRYFLVLLGQPVLAAAVTCPNPTAETLTEAKCNGKDKLVQGCSYAGCQTKTRSGRTCQRWDSQSPQEHSLSATGAHNYCRNPDSEPSIWCYTTDPKVRWEYCFPVVADYGQTTCETSVQGCKMDFGILNAATMREKCYLVGDVSKWGLDLKPCCQYMADLGACALKTTSEGGCGATDPNSQHMLVQGSTKFGLAATNFGLAAHMALAGPLCQCANRCQNAGTVLGELVSLGVTELMAVLGAAQVQGKDHPLMQKVCHSTGWACMSTKDECKDIKAHALLQQGIGAVGGLSDTHCTDDGTLKLNNTIIDSAGAWSAGCALLIAILSCMLQ